MSFPAASVLMAGLVGMLLATLVAGLIARLGFPVPDEKRRMGTIDGLRGYLALLVMVHHFAIYLLLSLEGGTWRDVGYTALNNFGSGSVSLFFMITGALFFRRAWNGIGGNDWRAMYISRVFRIIPLQILTVALIATIALIRVDFSIGNSWVSFPARFLVWLTSYSQPMLFGYPDTAMINAFVLWSLWAEWKFYVILLPLIALGFTVMGPARKRWVIPVLLLLSGIAFRYSGSSALQAINYAIFACGMLALLAASSRFAPMLRSVPAAMVGGAALILSMSLSAAPDYPLPLAGYTLFFLCVICGNRFAGLLTSRGALVLGEASFSIYMLHGIVLNIVFVSGGNVVARIPASARPWMLVVLLPLMGAIATLTYLLVERPGIAAGRRVVRRWGSPPRSKPDVSAEAAAP